MQFVFKDKLVYESIIKKSNDIFDECKGINDPYAFDKALAYALKELLVEPK